MPTFDFRKLEIEFWSRTHVQLALERQDNTVLVVGPMYLQQSMARCVATCEIGHLIRQAVREVWLAESTRSSTFDN